MHKRCGWFGVLWIGTMAISASAAAQPGERLPPVPPPVAAPAATPPAVAPAGAPASAREPSAAPAPAPAPAAMPTFELCTPACRAGFVCAQGQCVSACNPPCAAGQQCTAAAQCERDPSVPPPAPFYGRPEAEILPGKSATAERHDGFMLRLAIGVGYGGATRDVSGDSFALLGGNGETKLSGLGGSFSLDIGGAPVENLVIHGRLSDYAVTRPVIRRRNSDLADRSEDAVTAVLIAPAVTYYFMPANVYVTGAIGLAAVGVAIGQEGDKAHGAGGFGLNLDVGKEWWVGDQWGLGVAGRFWYSLASHSYDEGVEADYSLTAFAVLFSATYQ